MNLLVLRVFGEVIFDDVDNQFRYDFIICDGRWMAIQSVGFDGNCQLRYDQNRIDMFRAERGPVPACLLSTVYE